MPLHYAILHHMNVADPHFDLMVETYEGSDLSTWRSPVWPIVATTPLVRLKDHRRLYLDFEGDLTQRRGRVERVTSGTCTVEVGPNGQWTVRLLTGASPVTLHIQPVVGDGWDAQVAG